MASRNPDRCGVKCLRLPDASAAPSPITRALLWIAAVVVVAGLAFLRIETEAEFTFSSAALVPIVILTWYMGGTNGLALTAIAIAAWTVADLSSGRHFSAAWIPLANGITRLATYSFVTLAVSRLHRSLLRERELSSCDPLTGLVNRRTFVKTGEFEVERARRYGHSVAVVFVDLDNFKQVNDTNGHAIGDAALSAAATTLRTSLRATDLVARIGGDEFGIVLPEIGYGETAETGRKLAAAMRATMARFPPASASIGIAWFGCADRSFQDMLRSADELMYAIKKDGKNEVRVRRMPLAPVHRQAWSAP